MAIILPYGLTAPEFRVLQEFRRLTLDTLPIATIKAIKHPAGGGEAPAVSLVAKGYLEAGGTGETFTLTQKAKDLLAIDPKPMVPEGADTDVSAAADAEVEGA